MDAKEISRVLREGRRSAGFRQDEVASRVGVGRTTIVAIESGNLGRTSVDTMISFAELAGLKIEAVPMEHSSVMLRRRIARLEHRLAVEKRRDLHLRVANTIAASPGKVADLVNKALLQVAQWEKHKTCSPFYINKWREILSFRREKIAEFLSGSSEWLDALFQNSPFGFVDREP